MDEKTTGEPQEQPEKRGWAEKMVATGDAMQGAGKATTKAGMSFMGYGCLVFVLLVLALIFWAVAC